MNKREASLFFDESEGWVVRNNDFGFEEIEQLHSYLLRYSEGKEIQTLSVGESLVAHLSDDKFYQEEIHCEV